jgi:formate dehydrogenase subunit delta
MSSTIETLRLMACDIAKNFDAMADANPELATANHIRKFWDPRMRELIIADDHSKLIPIAREAVEHLTKVDNVGRSG